MVVKQSYVGLALSKQNDASQCQVTYINPGTARSLLLVSGVLPASVPYVHPGVSGGKRVLITPIKMRRFIPKKRQKYVKMAVHITSKGINSAVWSLRSTRAFNWMRQWCTASLQFQWLAQPPPHDLFVGEILVFLLFRGKLTKHANHGMRQDVQLSSMSLETRHAN